MSLSAKRWAYSGIPSFLSLSSICCMAVKALERVADQRRTIRIVELNDHRRCLPARSSTGKPSSEKYEWEVHRSDACHSVAEEDSAGLRRPPSLTMYLATVFGGSAARQAH
jgi:hypothetical protein